MSDERRVRMGWPERVNVRVAPEQRAALIRIAEAQHTTPSAVVRQALAHLLRDHEPEGVPR